MMRIPSLIRVTMLISALSVVPMAAFGESAVVSVSGDQDYFSLRSGTETYSIISKEHEKEYASYYQVIRKKIIERLRRNYTGYYRDGDVNIYFVLEPGGSLVRIDIDLGNSTKDTKLINIALSSLKQASPFPPFPKELSMPRLPFSVIVSFKETGV